MQWKRISFIASIQEGLGYVGGFPLHCILEETLEYGGA